MEEFSIELLNPQIPDEPGKYVAQRENHIQYKLSSTIPEPALNSLENLISAKNEIIDKEEIIEIINECFSKLKVYVLESEITQAQNNIKAIIEQSKI